jgi:NitT/TauT family transport system substrate-binding protein
MKRMLVTAALALAAAPAASQDAKVNIGISGWTGFAPLTLAAQAGIFKKNGVDVTIKKIPQQSRHLAIASGDIQCAATTAETWLVWNANGVATRQIFQMDKSYGADGMATRPATGKIADLKGKTIGSQSPGTSPYFVMAWMLKKNGLTPKDVRIVSIDPGPAAQAFLAGQYDAVMTYEPYLSSIRAKPDAGKIIATTLDYPVVMDTFGCTPKYLAENARVARAITQSYFQALEMIAREPQKSYEIMGADVKQGGEQFAKSAAYLRWQDRAANQKFFAGELQAFLKEAGALLTEIGIIKSMPDVNSTIDTSYIK